MEKYWGNQQHTLLPCLKALDMLLETTIEFVKYFGRDNQTVYVLY